MAVKTFVANEVLTASDTNTYLTNGGLVYVTSTTVGSAVSSVTVSNCFSSTYDHYVVQVAGGASSASTEMYMTLNGTSSGYYYQFVYTAWNTTVSVDASTTGTKWPYAGSCSANGIEMNATLLSPNLAKVTRISAMATGALTSYVGNFVGMLNNTTQYTGFTVAPTSGTLTGGTITVYGYRKA